MTQHSAQDQAHANQFQQQMEQLGKDPKFRAAMDELDKNPTLRHQAAADPHRHFQSKGVNLPQGATFKIKPDNWCVASASAFGFWCCWTWPANFWCQWGDCCP